MKKYTEENLQSEAFVYFNNNYCLKHHTPRFKMILVPNEISMLIRSVLLTTKLPKSKVDQIIAIISQRLKNTGLSPGASDNIIIGKGKTFFVEFKLPGNYQQDNQKEFEQVVTELDHTYVIIRSLDEFKEFVEKEVIC